MNGWFSLFTIIFGILANSITICALLHRHMRKSSTNAYLLALSSSNLASLICLLLMVGLRFVLVHPYRLEYCKNWYESFISRAIPYLTPINQLFQLSGIYSIISVSIDRLILVRKHVKPTACNRKKRRFVTWLVIFFIFLFCFIFTLPNWFLYKSKLVEANITSDDLIKHHQNAYQEHEKLVILKGSNKKSNQTQSSNFLFKIEYYKSEYTEFGQNSVVKEIINLYLYIPFVFGIPIIVLLIVNFMITYELIKIGARKRQLGTAANLDRNITIMLIMIVIIFLICQVPLAFSHILLAQYPQMMFGKKFFYYHSFTNFLTCVNLSANFALFCFFGQAFRDTIQFMFCIKDHLPDQAKRAPSIFITNDFNKRKNSLFQMLNSFSRSRNNSVQKDSLENRRQRHRRSLPTIRLQRPLHKDKNYVDGEDEKATFLEKSKTIELDNEHKQNGLTINNLISKNSKLNISIEQKSNVDASFNEPDEKTKINCKRRFSEQLPTKFYF